MFYLEIMPGLADHSQEPPAWLLCQIKATITLADKRQLECIHEKRNRLVSLSIPTPVYFLPKTVLRQKLRWTAYKWGLGDQWSTEAKAAFWELNISRKISMFKAQYNFFFHFYFLILKTWEITETILLLRKMYWILWEKTSCWNNNG